MAAIAYIEEFRDGLFLWPPHLSFLAGKYLRNGAVGVVQVSNYNGLRWTNHYAGRFKANIDAACTEVTLLSAMALGVYIDGVVGAGGYAGLAPYAYVPVEVYDPVGTLVHGGSGTCVNTGRLVTLVTAGDLKVVSGIGEGPHHHLLYISTRNPQGHAVFLFAGDGAGVTPDTPVLV